MYTFENEFYTKKMLELKIIILNFNVFLPYTYLYCQRKETIVSKNGNISEKKRISIRSLWEKGCFYNKSFLELVT